jgi:DNA-binding SARP family transcriptional activator
MGGKRRAGTQAIELRLLGTFEALRGGRPVGVGGPKPKALLALLATDVGRAVSIDRLVEELLPVLSQENSSQVVYVYVL